MTAFDLGSAESTVSPLEQRIRDCMDRETIVVEALKALKAGAELSLLVEDATVLCHQASRHL